MLFNEYPQYMFLWIYVDLLSWAMKYLTPSGAFFWQYYKKVPEHLMFIYLFIFSFTIFTLNAEF